MCRTCSDVLGSLTYKSDQPMMGQESRELVKYEDTSQSKDCRTEIWKSGLYRLVYILGEKQNWVQTLIISYLHDWNNSLVDLQVSQYTLSYSFSVLLQISFSLNTLLIVLFPSNQRRKIKSLQPIKWLNISSKSLCLFFTIWSYFTYPAFYPTGY